MDILYKYVSEERVFDCLPKIGNGTLRATQPASLNDPFECAVTPTFIETNLKYENKELSKILTSIHGTSYVSPSDVDNARNRYGTLFQRELLSRQLSQRFGIISFTRDHKHPLMWSHYANEGVGFVISYDSQIIRNLGNKRERLVQVEYEQRPLPIRHYEVFNEDNIKTFLSRKGDYWLYEAEWRLIVELDETIGTAKQDQYGQPINLLRVPNEAVKCVYYTERTPIDKVNEVQRRLKDPNNRYKAEFPVKLVMSDTRYGYEEVRTR